MHSKIKNQEREKTTEIEVVNLIVGQTRNSAKIFLKYLQERWPCTTFLNFFFLQASVPKNGRPRITERV